MITDKDVMYIYSEVINQMEPQKILDVGMFYKAIGAVSRRILEMEVPEDCHITGVETDSISGLNVYETIYNEIVSADDIDALIAKCGHDEYKVAVFLSDMIPEVCKEVFLKKAFMMSKYLFIYGVVSLKRLLNQSNLKSWSSKMIKKSLEAYFFTLKNKIVFCKKQFQNMSVFCFVSTEIV